MPAKPQRRFLIARMSAIGDTILTMPVACALRAQYPHAFIAWVVEKTASAMLVDHPCVDELVVLERGWFVNPRQIMAVKSRLSALRIDTAIDCQSVTKSALACWLSGAPTRIGCRGQYGSELSPWLNNRLIEPTRPHLTDRSLELLSAVDIHKPRVDWQMSLPADASRKMKRLVWQLGLTQGFAVINPGATWDSKLWEMDRFAAVTHHLSRTHRLPTVVVWGGLRERQWAERILATAHPGTIMAPATSLHELAALIQQARLFLSADTGPLHMAVALGTPSIGLYGATRIEDCGPYGAPHQALQTAFDAGSRRERRHADNHAMRQITVEMVQHACDGLLSATHVGRADAA